MFLINAAYLINNTVQKFNIQFPLKLTLLASFVGTLNKKDMLNVTRIFKHFSKLICLLLILANGMAYSQQVIGSFPNTEGGFDGTTAGSLGTTLSSSAWTRQNTANTTGTITATGGRSSSPFATVSSNSATATRVLQSPQQLATAASTAYRIQFYYKSSSNATLFQSGVSFNGTSSPTYTTTATLNSTSGVWTKYESTVTLGGGTVTSNGIAIVRFSGNGGNVSVDIDDLVVYAGAVDNTAPNSPGTVTVSNPTATTLDVSWGAASGGVDGGGYVVVRYAVNPNADNDPNANGIYSVGNTHTNGTGSLTGTIRYIGTGTSFTDNVGLSTGVTYYYKVYSVDKAFNYSAESSGNGTTVGTPTITPSLASLNLGNTEAGSSSGDYTYTVTGSNLTNNLVITAPTNYELSLNPGGPYSSSLNLTPAAAGVGPIIYAQFSPATAVGTSSGNITHVSTGATSQNVAVTANGLSTEPSAQATFSNISSITSNSFTINFAAGTGGNNRLVVVRPTSAVNFTPVDATSYTANSDFSAGTAVGPNSDCKIVFAGNGTSVAVTGLSASVTYHVAIFEYNSTIASNTNYRTTSPATGNATTAGGTPTVTTPVASNITHNSATLGATVTADGGASLSARGTVYKTSSPVIATDNALAEGGTAVSAFTHSRTSLTPQTLYFFSGYATNTGGTTLSSEGSFRTLSSPPTVQASSLSTSNLTTSSIDLSINTPATFPGSDATQAGYVVIYSTGTPTLSATNGQAPAAGVGTIFSTSATTLPGTPSTSISITGLNANTTYNILVVPYTWDGTNAATYNYLTASAPTTTAATTLPTYTWAGANNASWATASNWTPTRTTPASTDIIVFNSNSTLTVTAVPTETIGRLQVSGSSTKITLQAASTGRVLTIGNTTGTDFTVASGCELNISGTNTLSLVTASGATGSVSGSMKFTQAAHTLIPTDASSVTFNNGAAFTSGDLTTTGFSGNVFGPNSGTVYNGVVFASGATFTQIEGSNPFAITQPNSRVQFQSGSNFIFGASTGSPSLSGRTYGNLEFNCTANALTTLTGASALTINGNLTVTAAGSAVNLNLTGGITITGNISVGASQTLGFSPASANNLNLNGTSQNISGTGTLTFGSNTTIVIGSATTINLLRTLNPGINISVPSGATFNVSASGNLTLTTTTINGAGAFTLSSGGTLTTNNASGVSGVITVSGTKTFNNAANYVFTGATTTAFGANFASVTANNITASANITFDKAVTLNGTLTLSSGTVDANNNLTIGSTGSLVHAGGSIINYGLPAVMNNFTPPSGTTSLSSNLELTGVLDLGANTLDIGNNNLVIAGDVSRTTGVIRSNGGSITVNGAAQDETLFLDQTTPGTTNRLASFTLNRSGSNITLGNELRLSGSLTPTAGTLISNGNLTLVSTISGTGRIGEIITGSDVTGNVNIQRFVVGGAGNRGWRTMSSPVSGFDYSQLADDIFITGPGGATNGFDASGSSASILTYEENPSNGRGWKSIAGTSSTLDAGLGMLVFYRGDRSQTTSITDNSVAPNSSAVDFLGSINKGTLPPTNLSYNTTGIVADDGWNYLGNPYPSEIDYSMLDKTANVSTTYYVFNPTTGNYVNRDPNANEHIAIGQGFFVQVDNTGQSVTFEEDDKVTSNPTAYFKTQLAPFTVKMFQDSTRFDVAWLKFDASASKQYVFNQDAIKFMNTRINVGFVTPDTKLTQRNVVPNLVFNATDTFTLRTTSTANGNYWLSFEELGTVNPLKNIFLIDLYNNNWINVRNTPTYAFSINNSIPATSGNRFQVVFTDLLSALPVQLLSFTAQGKAGINTLTWEVAAEKNIQYYEIQRADDGKNFTSIDLVKAKNTGEKTTYTYIDKQAKGTVYYRLHIVELNQQDNKYSSVVVVNEKTNQKNNLTFYPNPAIDEITLQNQHNEAIGKVSLYDVAGKLVYEKQFNDTQVRIPLTGFEKGIYFLQDATGLVTKLVIQ